MSSSNSDDFFSVVSYKIRYPEADSMEIAGAYPSYTRQQIDKLLENYQKSEDLCAVID